jgi:general secretion pathway protein G
MSMLPPVVPKHPAPRRAPWGFTLLEILVVIVVIAILATLVAPNVFRHVGTAQDASARSQIEMLGAALDAYRLDNGRYPTNEQGLAALWAQPQLDPRPRNWRGPYLRKEVPLDPWDTPYIYRSPGQETQLGYEIISYAADGQPGGEGEAADIKSWESN